jgi:Holliday junction DNA helicase RuvA
MKVSTDAIRLYCFSSAEEREWFRLLQTVQNVGGKVALSVLSTLSPRELERALALSDKAMIGRAPGVGPKLALRIATELKDKVSSMMAGGVMLRGEGGRPTPRGPAADAVTALVKLGYSESQAAEAVARAANDLGIKGEAAETGVLLREALRGMAR